MSDLAGKTTTAAERFAGSREAPLGRRQGFAHEKGRLVLSELIVDARDGARDKTNGCHIPGTRCAYTTQNYELANSAFVKLGLPTLA